MDVKDVRWVGVQTSRYEGDEIQVMAPGDPHFDFFGTNARGPVPLFEVDDVRGARGRLEEAGIEIVGALERDASWEWIHVRAPDGNLYELASRRSEEMRQGSSE